MRQYRPHKSVQMTLFGPIRQRQEPHEMQNDSGWCGAVADHDITIWRCILISASTCQRYCRSSNFSASVPDFISSFKQDRRLLQHVGSLRESKSAESAWSYRTYEVRVIRNRVDYSQIGSKGLEKMACSHPWHHCIGCLGCWAAN
jgi:hypothetical protein